MEDESESHVVRARALAERLAALSAEAGATLAVFVPVDPTEKKPLVKHRGGQWSHGKAVQWLMMKQRNAGAGGADFRIGMLLYGLMVLDFDRADLYPAWAAEFPELEMAPAEQTRKGIHCYFLRCPAAEAASLTDGPLNDPGTGLPANIDAKTVTANAVRGCVTGSLLVCAPSRNYSWLEGRSLLELGPKPMSSELLKKVSAWRRAGVRESEKGCGSKRPRATDRERAATAGQLEAAPRLEPAFFATKADLKELLGLLGLQTDMYSAIQRLEPLGTSLEGLTLRPDKDRPDDHACAVCKGTHKDSLMGTIWLSSASSYELKVQHRRHKECHKRYIITPAKARAFRRRFEGGDRVPAEEAARVAQLLAATGSLTPADPRDAVWPLPDPAPGVRAHAIRVGEAWRLLLSLERQVADVEGTRTTTTTAWSRTTCLPGLKYELLRPFGDWACSVRGRGAPRPPFWPVADDPPLSFADDIGRR